MILGLIGFAGSGKGTAGDILIDGLGFTRLSFADPVKDCASAIFGWERRLLEGNTDESRVFRETVDVWWSKKFGRQITPRAMLQIIGTEAGRNVIDPEIWINSLENKLSKYKNVVIPDVRFPNELQFIKRNGGFNIRVIRGKEPVWFDTAKEANASEDFSIMEKYNVHYSEWAWIGQTFDFELYNTSSKEALEVDIKHMLKIFTGPVII